jgi:HK97 family phage portal protein
VGIFDSIGRFFSRKQDVISRATKADGDGLVVDMIHGRSPPRRGTLEFLRANKTLPVLGAITRKRALGVAGIQWRLYTSTPGTVALRQRGLRGKKGKPLREACRALVDNGRLEEVERSPLLDLLEKPNRAMTGRTFWILTSKHIDLVGESFWMVDRDLNGTPIGLWVVPPTWVKKVPDFRDPTYEVQNNAWRARIPEGDMVWIKDHDVEQPYDRGAGVGMSLGDEIETDEYAARMAKALYFNRGTPGLMVTVEGVQSKAELEAFKQEWMQKNGGPGNAGQPHFVTKKVSAEQLSQTFVEAQHNEHRKFGRDAQMFGYGMPPEAMGVVENSNRATIESAEYFLAKYGTEPMADLICSELNAWVVRDFGEHLFLHYEDVVPENVERADALIKATPWMCKVNELRERAGLEPLEGIEGEIFVVPSGLGAVSDLTALALPSATMMPAAPTATGQSSTPMFDQMLEALGLGPMAATPLWQQMLAGALPLATPPAPPSPAWKALPGFATANDPATADAAWKALPGFGRALPAHHAAELDRILNAATPEDLWEPLEPVMRDLLQAWGERTFEEIGKSADDFDAGDPRLQRQLDDMLRKDIEQLINKTTRDNLRAALVDALNNGTSLDAAAREVFVDADTKRAGLIANQSTVVMTERTKLSAFAQAGVAKREWISTPDGRTRASHWALDGQQVPLNQRFVVPAGEEHAGASTMEPGGFGVPELDINCRCTTAAVVNARMSPADRRLFWRKTETDREPWYDRTERAISRGFGRQMRAVLAAIAALE